jgi:hypothetical protein
MTNKRGPTDPEDAQWKAAAGWEAAAEFRRQRDLALSPAERLAIVEEMIRMAIAAGTFRPKPPR